MRLSELNKNQIIEEDNPPVLDATSDGDKTHPDHQKNYNDPVMDRSATPRPIDYSIKTVICNILDGNGKVVTCNGKPVEVARNFPMNDLDAVLAKESLVFVRFWDW